MNCNYAISTNTMCRHQPTCTDRVHVLTESSACHFDFLTYTPEAGRWGTHTTNGRSHPGHLYCAWVGIDVVVCIEDDWGAQNSSIAHLDRLCPALMRSEENENHIQGSEKEKAGRKKSSVELTRKSGVI